MPGSIITSGNYIYYISYNDVLTNRLVKLDPYTGARRILLTL